MKDEKRTNVVWKFEGKMRVGPQNIGIFGSHEVSGDVRERERRRCVCLGVSGCVWMCLRVSLCTCVRKEPGSSYTPNIKRAKVDGFCGTHVLVASQES